MWRWTGATMIETTSETTFLSSPLEVRSPRLGVVSGTCASISSERSKSSPRDAEMSRFVR